MCLMLSLKQKKIPSNLIHRSVNDRLTRFKDLMLLPRIAAIRSSRLDLCGSGRFDGSARLFCSDGFKAFFRSLRISALSFSLAPFLSFFDLAFLWFDWLFVLFEPSCCLTISAIFLVGGSGDGGGGFLFWFSTVLEDCDGLFCGLFPADEPEPCPDTSGGLCCVFCWSLLCRCWS